MNKYEMIKCENLYQIKALRNIGLDVTKGDLGGYVENEGNLSQDGEAWIFENARVSGNAYVLGSAVVSGSAVISGSARVSGDACVSGDAMVLGNARVSGDAWVFGDASVSGDARVYGNTIVSGDALVSGSALVSGNAVVSGWVYVHGNAHISEEISVKKGEYVEDLTCNRNYLSLLRNEFSVSPVNDMVILYKKVNSTSDKDIYTSCFDPNFIYEVGKTAVAEKVDGRMISCATGLHVSTPSYWKEGDTLIAVEINTKDIITIQEGKVRVSKLKVIGACAK